METIILFEWTWYNEQCEQSARSTETTKMGDYVLFQEKQAKLDANGSDDVSPFRQSTFQNLIWSSAGYSDNSM